MQLEGVFCGRGAAQIPLCFICFGLFHSYYESAVTAAVLVLLSVFKGGVYPRSLCFELRGLPPLSLIIAFGSVPWQEMRDLFYLAWTTLFLPDYWCYFTLNNMTLCSQSAQGQSLRVIDTFKSRGGEYNQREEWGRKGRKKRTDAKVKLAAGLRFLAGSHWKGIYSKGLKGKLFPLPDVIDLQRHYEVMQGWNSNVSL